MTASDSSTDALFEILADGHRREVLTHLLESEVATVEELVEVVAYRATAGREIDSDTIATRLHHVHLPKLDAAGLVDYESAAGTAKYVGSSEVASLLAAAVWRPASE